MGTGKKNTKNYSISFVIITVLVTFSVIGSVTLLLLSKNYSESALHDLADDVIKRTVTDSAEHINHLLIPALDAVGAVSPIIPADISISTDENDNRKLINSMIKTLERHKGVYTVYYANTDGEFFLVGKRQRYKNDERKFYFHKRIIIKDGVRQVSESWYSDGGEVEHNSLPEDTYDPRVRPWYKKALYERGSVWTSPYIFYITKLPGITYAEPVREGGVIKGVVAADLEIDTISDYLIDGLFTKNTHIFAIDGNDNLLAHSEFSSKYDRRSKLMDHIPKSSDFDDSIIHYMTAKHEISGGYGNVINVGVNHEHFKAILQPFVLSGLSMVIGVYTPSEDYLGPLHKKYRVLFILSALIVLGFFIFSRLVSRTVAKPFEDLSAATEDAKDLKFDKKINIISSFREVSLTQNNFNEMLESLNNYKSANELLSETLHNAHIDTLYRLAMAAEHKDQYTYDHLKRVSDISSLVADVMGFSSHDIEQIRHASAMHDVGKLGIPDSILMKPGRLTESEFDVIKKHSELGAKILENPSSEEMSNARIIARAHHEKWNGTGYPHNLKGEDIPLYGRIVALADVIDALLSKRPYKEPFSFEKTIMIVRFERGKHFDPELTDIILENQGRLLKLVN